MARTDEAKIAAERKEREERETAQFGKVLGSMPGSEEDRRQQALAKIRSKAQAKRDGKRVAVTDGEADNAHKQAPPKRARAPRNVVAATDGEADNAHKQAPPKRARAPRNVGAAALEKTNKEDDGTQAPTTRARPRRTQVPLTENPELKLAKERAKKAGKKPMVEASVSEEDEASSDQEAEAPPEKEDEAPSDVEHDDSEKSKYTNRDRTKTPTEAELVDLLRNGVAWPPTRFLHRGILQDISIEDEVEAMLNHMKVGCLYGMAYPTYQEVSCQFLATLEATFHTVRHEQQGWGAIQFKIDDNVYSMSFTEIGEALDLQDQRNPSLPKLKSVPRVKNIEESMWNLLTGLPKGGKKEKNTCIRHPTVRYLHRLLNHTLFQKKEVGNVAGEELRFLHQAVQHFASPPQLPVVPGGFYSDFGMVGFLVQRLLHYKKWAWTTHDWEPQLGMGGLITPLLAYHRISLGNDATGPTYLDGSYLKKAQYFSGTLDGRCVYSYMRANKKVELTLPNHALTMLPSFPGAIRFDISEEHLLKSHGALGPCSIPVSKKKREKVLAYNQGATSEATKHLFGPPRYHFDQCTGALPHGPIRQAHDQISKLQRWSRAQDRTIFKLTNKCKELKKTVKRQAEASAQFMRKVADILTRGAVAGCKADDFDLDAFLAPPPQPLLDPSAPCTAEQSLRRLRNPYIRPSESGNKSPSLASTDEEDDSEGEASASSHAP